MSIWWNDFIQLFLIQNRDVKEYENENSWDHSQWKKNKEQEKKNIFQWVKYAKFHPLTLHIRNFNSHLKLVSRVRIVCLESHFISNVKCILVREGKSNERKLSYLHIYDLIGFLFFARKKKYKKNFVPFLECVK